MTYRAIVFKTLFPTDMHRERPRHAGIAIHAVEIIDTQTLPKSTEVTERAVVDMPVHRIIMDQQKESI